MATIGIFVALTSLLSLLLGAMADEIGTDCSLKGFGSNLLCSSCDELKRFELSELRDDCLKCCQKTGSNEQVSDVPMGIVRENVTNNLFNCMCRSIH